MRVAELIKPDLLLIENVSGITTAGNGSFKDAILKEMEGLGYHSKWTILNAVDFGVPQIRKRVIFIGVKNKNTFSWPTPTHGPHRKKYVTVKDAISDLPPLGTGQSENQYFKTPESDYQKLMRDQAFELLNHEAPSHPPETIERIKNTKPGEPMYPKFKQRIRLHFDKPSPTQVSGGIRPQFQFGHPSQPRGLTVRERCRIQSIPDTYIIEGGIVQGRVQTGNAVPPLLAKALGIELLKTLKGECEAPQIKSSIQMHL
jgi:DNA (cytosine-5)-methyltransferase 1